MKTIYTVLIFVAFCAISMQSKAQALILASDLTNAPATDCDTTWYTVSGTLANTNYGYTGPIISIVGSNIEIDMQYYSGFAPQPGLTPFTENIELGLLPIGTYTVTTTASVDGILTSTDVGTFAVETCCALTIDLGADTLICDTASLVLNPNAGNVSYVWQDASTSSTYTVTSAGTYWVEVVDGNGCMATDTIVVTTEDCSLGLNALEAHSNILLFPNPASSVINVEGLPIDAHVRVYSRGGELLFEVSNAQQIDVSSLKAGVYFMEITSDLGRSSHRVEVIR